MTEFNSKLYFSANDGIHGFELWSCNSSNACSMVRDIRTGESGSSPAQLTKFNSTLYFTASREFVSKLWSCDTNDIVVEIIIGTGISSPQQLFATSSALYLRAATSSTGHELWRCSMTEECSMVADLNPGGLGSNPFGIARFNSKLYF